MNTRTEKAGPARYHESVAKMIWLRQDLLYPPLRTEEGCAVRVEFPGVPNPAAGPDFLKARIWFEGRLLSGDVEIHVEPHMWEDHGHQHDPLYGGVILHATLRRGSGHGCTKSSLGNPIPTLVLQSHLNTAIADVEMIAGHPNPNLRDVDAESALLVRTQGEIRMLAKIERARHLIAANGYEESLYRQVMTALGYRYNKAQFLQLATLVPYSALSGLSEVEARRLLIHVAGFAQGREQTRVRAEGCEMQREFWHTRGVRPSNHPVRRIEAAAALFTSGQFEKIMAIAGEARELLPTELANLVSAASGNGIGEERAIEIVMNVILPFTFARNGISNLQEVLQMKLPPPPYVNRMCDEIGINLPVKGGDSTVALVFGIIQWHTNLLSGKW